MVAVSKALTDAVNALDLGADRSFIVNVFGPEDTPRWKTLPAVWHLHDASTICLNWGKLCAVLAEHPSVAPGIDRASMRDSLHLARDADGNSAVCMHEDTIDLLARKMVLQTQSKTESARHYSTFDRRGHLNTNTVENRHPRLARQLEVGWHFYSGNIWVPAYNMAMGAVMREAAYSVFRQPMLGTDWHRDTTGYQKNIIAVLDELRIEAQQIRRINSDRMGLARRFLRSALPVTANSRAIIADMTKKISTNGTSGMGVANIALNGSLLVGRTTYGVLLPFEVKALNDQLDTYLGTQRLLDMEKIWLEYIEIGEPTEDNIMPLVQRWEALFPSAKDGSKAGSTVAAATSSTPPPATPSTSTGPESESEDGTEDGDPTGTSESEGQGDDGEAGEDGQDDGAAGSTGAATEEGTDHSSGDGVGQDTSSFDETTGEDGGDVGSGKGDKGGVTSTTGNQFTGADIDPDADDPGKQEDVVAGGLDVDEIQEEADELDTIGNADYSEPDFGPNDITPSRRSYEKAKHRKPSRGKSDAIESGREIEPSTADYGLANTLSRALENLNVTDRGKFTTNQVTPPGRMRSRAAVQQAAEKQLRLPETARPWKRTMRTVDLNPPLTIGVMTDVSSSQGWAEQVSAKLAWILSHAVSKINGRVACVTFGTGITITLRPGEKMHNAQVVRADDGGELFDYGAGTVDTMLNLVHGQGTRLLFVLTDGRFGIGNELQKAAAWVEMLNARGVHVVWVTPDPDALLPVDERRTWSDGLPTTPKGVIAISARPIQLARKPEDVAKAQAQVINDIANEVTKAVRMSKRNSR
jgi:hypothetical protein